MSTGSGFWTDSWTIWRWTSSKTISPSSPEEARGWQTREARSPRWRCHSRQKRVSVTSLEVYSRTRPGRQCRRIVGRNPDDEENLRKITFFWSVHFLYVPLCLNERAQVYVSSTTQIRSTAKGSCFHCLNICRFTFYTTGEHASVFAVLISHPQISARSCGVPH